MMKPIFDWIDVNIVKINHYICIIQIVLITGIAISIWKRLRLHKSSQH